MSIKSVVFWDENRNCGKCDTPNNLNDDGLCSSCAIKQAGKNLAKLKTIIEEDTQ